MESKPSRSLRESGIPRFFILIKLINKMKLSTNFYYSDQQYITKLSKIEILDQEKTALHCAVSDTSFPSTLERLSQIYGNNPEDH